MREKRIKTDARNKASSIIAMSVTNSINPLTFSSTNAEGTNSSDTTLLEDYMVTTAPDDPEVIIDHENIVL